MPKIAKRVVDAAEPAEKSYFLWDTEVRGFGLLVLRTGVRSYVYQYRDPRGRTRRATIGKHGEWTAAQARERAEALRDLVRAGRDPLAEKAARREAPTVGDLLDRYLASERFAAKAPSTRGVDRGRIERHLRPLLGRTVAASLTIEGVRRAHAAIRDGKTAAKVKTKPRGVARVKGGETTARDTVQLLKAILNWAVAERMLATNEAAGLKFSGHGRRETILEGPADYARLFASLATMEAERRLRAPVADAIRVIALTGCRKGEIANLRWSHVDLRNGRLVLPPGDHKGRRTGRPRIITLPAAAQEIVARQPAGEPAAFVFAAAKGSGPLDLGDPWRRVRDEAALPAGMGLHGLRHSMASALAMGGAGASEIQTALGHATVAMAVRYVHWADRARAALAERAAAPALAGLAAAEGRPAAPVATLPGAKEPGE